jgi:hypothetical protein
MVSFLIFCGTGYQTQGLMYTKQTLNHCATSPAPLQVLLKLLSILVIPVSGYFPIKRHREFWGCSWMAECLSSRFWVQFPAPESRGKKKKRTDPVPLLSYRLSWEFQNSLG